VKITKTLTPEKPTITRQPPTSQVVKRVLPASVNTSTPIRSVNSSPNVIVTEQKIIRRGDDGTMTEKIVISPKTQRLINRTDPVSGSIEKAAIDKIMAKRMNPRKRENEYLVKWESKPQTWECASHLETCKDLIENFEILLAKQKEMRAKSAAQQQAQTLPSTPIASQVVVQQASATSTPIATPNRPERSSKQKAINQVKQWTGGNKHQDDSIESQGIKRKAIEEDDEFDEEIDGDDVDDEDYELESSWEKKKMAQQLGQTSVKKIKTDVLGQNGSPRVISKAGDVRTIGATTVVRKVVGTKSPDVIMAGQKQVSGVFKKASPTVNAVKANTPTGLLPRKVGEGQVRIVEKKDQIQSGIVRVNQVGTPKGTTVTTRVVSKPSPAPGARQQTQVVRSQAQAVQNQQKALAQKIIQQRSAVKSSPNTPTSSPGLLPRQPATTTTPASGQVVRKVGATQVTKKTPVTTRVVKKTAANVNEQQQEEDDGLEDPFPKDLPPIENDSTSPPPPLTLCPITGKVLGESGEIVDAAALAAAQAEEAEGDQQHQITQLLTNEDGSPIYITGDDGTMYQVAGKNANGETILVSTNAEGEQTCVLLPADQDILAGLTGIQTSDVSEVAAAGQTLTEDGTIAESGSATEGSQDEQYFAKDENEAFQLAEGADGAAVNQPLSIAVSGEGGDSQDGQITAEIVQADEPSPGK
jgi:hypothetical protein